MPVYAVFLTPEIFNFSIVFVAYFLWLYKEVAEPRSRWLRGIESDVVAAILLGVATYSKPYSQRAAGVAAGAVVLVAASMAARFRRRGRFRRRLRRALCRDRACLGRVQLSGGRPQDLLLGARVGTAAHGRISLRGRPMPAGIGEAQALARTRWAPTTCLQLSEITRLFRHNVTYFLFGRHFGLVPYLFPGVLAVLLWLFSQRARRRLARDDVRRGSWFPRSCC